MDETPDPKRRREEEMDRLRYEETVEKNAIRKAERRMDREYRTLAGEVEALGEDIKQTRNFTAKVRADAEPDPSDLLYVDHRKYPAAHGEEVVLEDGAHILIRPVEAADCDELKLGSEHVWALSRYRHSRAMGAYLDAQRLVAETEGEHPSREALIAISLSTHEGIGIALYSCDPDDPAQAEVDCTVLDLWQNRGVGTALAERLARLASQHGVDRLTARMLVDDEGAMHLLSHVADVVDRESDSGIVTVTARLRRPPG